MSLDNKNSIKVHVSGTTSDLKSYFVDTLVNDDYELPFPQHYSSPLHRFHLEVGRSNHQLIELSNIDDA